MPYQLDGTVVKQIDATVGVVKTFTPTELVELNDEDYVGIDLAAYFFSNGWITFFFPELVDITQIFAISSFIYGATSYGVPTSIQWSPDSTNGLDGTWNNAVMPNGYNGNSVQLDAWRTGFKAMTGVTGAIALRIRFNSHAGEGFRKLHIIHLYGHKHAGETIHDILFLDALNGDAEFAIPLDFGDIPSGTSIHKQIKLQNVSGTLTANNITVTVLDPADPPPQTGDTIRINFTDTDPWNTTETVVILAPGAKSAIIYVKCEAHAPPTALGPDRAPIKVQVGAWT
jgi:hypothetical protein